MIPWDVQPCDPGVLLALGFALGCIPGFLAGRYAFPLQQPRAHGKFVRKDGTYTPRVKPIAPIPSNATESERDTLLRGEELLRRREPSDGLGDFERYKDL